MSLIELSIGAGIMGALAVGGSKLFQDQSKAQKTVEKNYEIASTMESIKSVLGHPPNCSTTFGGQLPAGGTVFGLRKQVSGVFENVFEVGIKLPGDITVAKYTLDNTKSGLASDEVALLVEFSRGKSAVREMASKMLVLSAVLDGDGKITSCYALTSNNGYWVRSVTQPNDIFYNQGNVGVGSPSPKAALDINGQLKLGPPGVCNADTNGSLAFNSGLGILVACLGGVWKPLGGVQTYSDYSAYCNSGGSSSQLVSMGAHGMCALTVAGGSNMGKDDHMRFRCSIARSGTNWTLEAICRESETHCSATCTD